MSTRPTPSRPRSRRLLAVAGALLLAIVVLPGRSSGEGIPGAGDLPDTTISNSHAGVATISQVAAVRSSKLFLSIGGANSPIWGAVYQPMFNFPVGDPNPTEYKVSCGTRAPQTPCVPWPFEQPECATADPSTQAAGVYFRGLIYPMTPKPGGVGADVGKISETKVNMVAFGSIPASATVTLRTPRVGNKVQPLVLHDWTSPGRANGCDPTFYQKFANQEIRVLVEGKVEITLSDLVVDGVPVDLGPRCRTVRAADLQLWSTANKSYAPAGGGTLGAWDGLQDTTDLPWNSPYYTAEENGRVLKPSTGLTIPPFTGCGTGGEDLSPLVTAVASGPNNPVKVMQGRLVQHQHQPANGLLDIDQLNKCQTATLCPLPGPDLPDRPPLPDAEAS
ncbi:hypothetical protein ACIRN4_12450 [Pimelobacter simplex]|uniref:hypothetical protein n=1 Tax=Nocardioides simplex TaxID=2045 RepID=UPI0037FE3988